MASAFHKRPFSHPLVLLFFSPILLHTVKFIVFILLRTFGTEHGNQNGKMDNNDILVFYPETTNFQTEVVNVLKLHQKYIQYFLELMQISHKSCIDAEIS